MPPIVPESVVWALIERLKKSMNTPARYIEYPKIIFGCWKTWKKASSIMIIIPIPENSCWPGRDGSLSRLRRREPAPDWIRGQRPEDRSQPGKFGARVRSDLSQCPNVTKEGVQVN
jgi:hypothetical protein